jgi:hypothetical protein
MADASTSPPSNNGTMSLGLYAIISAVYLWVDYLNNSISNKNEEPASDTKPAVPKSKIFAFLFLVIVWLTQFFITFFSLKQQCVTPNYGLAAWSSFATWFVLFVPMFWCLEYLYTWLQPFGNTFGYLIIKLDGLVSFMEKILKSKSDDKIQKYLNYMQEDPWALFSMLTTYETAPEAVQAGKKYDDLNTKKYLNDTTPEDRATFVNYVRVKENIAKFIFYILTLNLMADLTSIIALENSPCVVPIDDSDVPTAPTNNPNNPTNNPNATTPSTTVYKTSE